ncbi:DUF4283 domain protein, partial [Trifolium medium]|nr:DUF4283 domain protein [Trifolium medium]
MQAVKVAEMGGSLVLFSREGSVDVGTPFNNLLWWDGLLDEIKPWSPNQVFSRRRMWVRMYGVPLHVWGVSTFQKIANRCGEFIATD